MSVAQDGNGWSQNTLGSGKKYVYVSASGSSGNTGLSSGSPKQTIAQGIALMSGGDGLLFNRGDTWTNQTFSGLPDGTTTDPTWVGYYGTGARPRFVITSGSSGIMDDTVNNVFFKGLHFASTIADASNNVTGFAVGCTGSNYAKFEDCVFKRMGTNLLVTGGSGSVIRRCICIDATLEDPSDNPAVYAFHSGMYSNFVTNLTIEENVFDQNGVLDESSVFNHNIYIDADTAGTTTVQYNLMSRCPSSCLKMLQQTGNLDVYRNLLSTCGDQMEVGAYGGEGEYPTGTHTVPHVEENVMVEGTKEFTESPGWGIRVRHSTGGYIRNNVMANRKNNGVSTESVPAIYIESVSWGPAVDDVEVYGNHRYNWRGADIWNQGANSGNLSHDNIIDEPNMDTSFGEPYVVALAATGIVTFTSNKYNRGGTSSGWFESPSGAQTFAQWQAAREASATSGATTWTDSTRTLTTWLTSVKGAASFDAGMTTYFRDENTIEDTTRITNIRAAHAWIAAGYNKDFGDVEEPEAVASGGCFAVGA